MTHEVKNEIFHQRESVRNKFGIILVGFCAKILNILFSAHIQSFFLSAFIFDFRSLFFNVYDWKEKFCDEIKRPKNRMHNN